MRADRSALGTLPAAAFQFCEPVRTATGAGWYIFPPRDATLIWDGFTVQVETGGKCSALVEETLGEAFQTTWDSIAPEKLRGKSLPWISSLSVQGFVQIWSGYFIRAKPGYGIWIRHLANFKSNPAYSVIEGFVEVDTYAPCPLFCNLQINKTDVPILIKRDFPLFQVMPIGHEIFDSEIGSVSDIFRGGESQDDKESSWTHFDWGGLSTTTRFMDERRPGMYGANVRRSMNKSDRRKTPSKS